MGRTLTLVLFITVVGRAGYSGTLNPIAVTGWEEDVVIGAGENYSIGTTVQMDNPASGGGATVWYGVGQNAGALSTGLSTGLIQSESTADLYFQLQSFTANNALYEGGTLTLTAAAAYDRIALLGATGQGISDITVTLKYTTGIDDVYSNLGSTGSVNQDWFNGSSIAYTADGRISTVSGAYEYVNSGNPRLYESFFDVDETRLLQSVVIVDTMDGTQHNVIMAISGEAVPEPATAGMLAGAGLLLAAYRRWFGRV